MTPFWGCSGLSGGGFPHSDALFGHDAVCILDRLELALPGGCDLLQISATRRQWGRKAGQGAREFVQARVKWIWRVAPHRAGLCFATRSWAVLAAKGEARLYDYRRACAMGPSGVLLETTAVKGA